MALCVCVAPSALVTARPGKTTLGDRVRPDGIVIAMLILRSPVCRPGQSLPVFDRYPMGEALHRYATDGSLWICPCAVALLAAVVVWLFLAQQGCKSMERSVARIWERFCSAVHYEGDMALFAAYRRYQVIPRGTYLCFYAFPFTRALVDEPGSRWGLVPRLMVFVFARAVCIVPSNGGPGPWNIAVPFASPFGIVLRCGLFDSGAGVC